MKDAWEASFLLYVPGRFGEELKIRDPALILQIVLDEGKNQAEVEVNETVGIPVVAKVVAVAVIRHSRRKYLEGYQIQEEEA